MYLILSHDVLKDENELALTSIVRLALHNRVFLRIENFDSALVQEWLQTQSAHIRASWQIVEKATIADLTRHRLVQSVRVSAAVNGSDWSKSPALITLDDAVDLAGQPKKIILENSRADRRFLLSMVDAKLRAQILEMEKNGSLSYVHGGGNGELRKQMEERILPLPWNRFVCWAFFDSDAANPGAIGQDAQALIDLCNSAQIPYHCLTRRAIENYVPKQAMLEAFGDSKHHAQHLLQVDAFFKMTAAQREHFHMKRGLDDNSCAQSGLYDAKSPTMQPIKKGFKENLADVYPGDNEAEMEKMFKYLASEKAQVELNLSLKTLKAMLRSPQ